jgi:phage terminase small subunit
MALTSKQKRFVSEYLVDLNATQAATRSGYSEKTARSQGQRMLTNADIADAIAEAQHDRSKRTEITQDYVLGSIFSTMERCKQAEAVTDRNGAAVLVETKSGDLAPAYTFNAMGVFKGAELLGKHLGMFAGSGADEADAPSVNITLTTSAPVGEIRVTRHKA